MDNKEFSRDLERRTRQFADDIIGLSLSLPNTVEAKVVRNRMTGVLVRKTGKILAIFTSVNKKLKF